MELSQLETDSKCSSEIMPGFHNLHSINRIVDTHLIITIEDKITTLMNIEHQILLNVHKNLIAVLKAKVPLKRKTAKDNLEEILNECPRNLNALADLEQFYKEAMCSRNALIIDSKIKNILNSACEDCVEERQLCLFEQGYAEILLNSLLSQESLQQRIKVCSKMLKTDIDICIDEELRTYYERGYFHLSQAQKSIQNAEVSLKRETNVTDRSSIENFEKAFALQNSSHTIWTYYYARALFQNLYFQYTIETTQNESTDLKQMAVKAIKTFWIFQEKHSNDSHLKSFVAKALVYLGHIFIKYRILISVSDINDMPLSGLKQAFENPMQLLEKAYSLAPDDTFILTRYARALWEHSKSLTATSRKLQILKRADEILTNAILHTNGSLWFAFSTRMSVYENIAELSNDQDKQFNYLSLAKNDGFSCLEMTTSNEHDIILLSDILQRLAKFPNVTGIGPSFVKTEEHIYEALDVLAYAEHIDLKSGYKLAERKASCLFDLGEYESAIDIQKTAVVLAPSNASPCSFTLFIFMLTLFEQNDLCSDTFFRECMYFLLYTKYKFKLNFDTIVFNLFQAKKALLLFLNEIIIVRKLLLSDLEEPVLRNVIEIVSQYELSSEFATTLSNIQQELKNRVPDSEQEYQLTDTFSSLTLELRPNVKPYSNMFDYDFFVSHSHKDKDWVNTVLLRILESQLTSDDVPFKGCIADRDFVPGTSIISNITDKISKSNKVLLVLSPNYIKSHWCNHEADQAICRSLKGSFESSVIPVRYQDCDIPEKLAHINYIDLRVNCGKDFLSEIMRLKTSLL